MDFKKLAMIGILVTFGGIMNAADDGATSIKFNPFAPAIKKPQDFIPKCVKRADAERDLTADFRDCLAASLISNSLAKQGLGATRENVTAIMPSALEFMESLSPVKFNRWHDNWIRERQKYEQRGAQSTKS